jgi:hypothetical protein
MDTYSVEMKITSSERDTFFIPIGRGVGDLNFVKRKKSLEKGVEQSLLEIDTLVPIEDGYGNVYIPFEVESNESIAFRRDVIPFPPFPDLDPNQCLGNEERFCKWRKDGTIEKIVNKTKNLLEKEKVLFFAKMIKKDIHYSYPRVKYEYTDEVLEKKLPQDCLGMHGVLCAMLRCSGIPSVVDVGLRLDCEDKPHVWLWYFSYENNTWQIVDLNDSRSEILIGDEVKNPRMSVSLGTTHNINNHTVSFVQYFVSEKILEGKLKQPHDIKTRIVKKR